MDHFDIPVGQNWPQVIEQALYDCGQFLVVLSPASVISDNVTAELNFAIEEGKKILPVLYRKCKRPFRIRMAHYADFTSGYESGLTSLLSGLSTPTDHVVEKEQPIVGGVPTPDLSPPSVALGQPTPIRKPKLRLRSTGAQRLFEPPLDNTWAHISLNLANDEYELPTPAHNVRASMAFLQPGSGNKALRVQRCFFLIGGGLQPMVRSLPRNEPCELVLAYTNDGKKFWAASSHTPSTIDAQHHLEAALWRCKVKVQSDEVSVCGVFELMLWDDRPIEIRSISEYSRVERSGGTYYDCNFCTARVGSEEGLKNHLAGCGC
jgi:hypothetical protein